MAGYSFVVPAYNAERTIRAAVDSIFENVPEAQVVIVENGSTDGTYAAAERLLNEHDSILLLRSRKGVSEARNTGIRNASGEWILFVDADDLWLGSTACLDSLTESGADLTVCSYRKGNGSVVHDLRPADEIKAWMLSRPTLRMTVWAKIFRREFLLENSLLFNTSLRYSEDSEFLVRCLNACRKAAVSEKIVYEYRLTDASAMRSADHSRTKGYLEALELISGELPHDNAYRNFVAAHVNLIGVHDIFDCAVPRSWKKRIRLLKRLLKQEVIREVTDQVTFPRSLNLLPVFLFRHRLYSLGGLICFLRSAANRAASKRSSKKEGTVPR